MMDYLSLDALAQLIDENEDPRALAGIATEATRLAGLARKKSARLAELARVCSYCFKSIPNDRSRCIDNYCPGWLP